MRSVIGNHFTGTNGNMCKCGMPIISVYMEQETQKMATSRGDMVNMNNKLSEGLVGKFLHCHHAEGYLKHFPEHRYINMQGQILSVTSRDNWGIPNAYEVQWFSCLTGEPTSSEIVISEQMLFEKWSFYEDDDKWREEFDKSIRLWRRNEEIENESRE